MHVDKFGLYERQTLIMEARPPLRLTRLSRADVNSHILYLDAVVPIFPLMHHELIIQQCAARFEGEYRWN